MIKYYWVSIMNIAVYDDNKSACEEVKKIITGSFDFSIICCYKERDLLSVIENPNYELNLLIIDIELENGKNGIKVASMIKNKLPNLPVIFLTAYGDIYHEKIFFNFQPYGLVTKPIQKNILLYLIKKLHNELNKNQSTIKFISNYQEYTIPVNQINYIQSIRRICEIITHRKNYIVYSKISDFEEKLNNQFLRCHQSYIINLSYIKSIKKNAFITVNNESIPISNKYQKDCEKIYNDYLKNTFL